MNVEEILKALNAEPVDYLLIGGMNFLLRHAPELTFDVDIWVRDDGENLTRLNRALERLGAQWGRTEAEWAPVAPDWRWLQTQPVFCLTTAHGAFVEGSGLTASRTHLGASKGTNRNLHNQMGRGSPPAASQAPPPTKGQPRQHQVN
jgi:prophage DNA circulation protein